MSIHTEAGYVVQKLLTFVSEYHTQTRPNGKVNSQLYSAFRTSPQTSDSCHQGFTAIVDKALSAKYEKLVNDASELIKVLPWGKDFEVDVFKKPGAGN